MATRARVQILLRPETHKRLTEAVPWGLRSGMLNLLVDQMVDLYKRHGNTALARLQTGEIFLADSTEWTPRK